VHATKENLRYLKTKRDRMGHDLPGLAAFEDEATEAAADLLTPAATDASARTSRSDGRQPPSAGADLLTPEAGA
jgi:3,4-dihydroxy 2-butanone 4-phosphate synthase/GTP cyclohydrolase II